MGKKKIEACCKCCADAIVELDATIALVVLILNVIPFTSGIGTCISACLGKKFNCLALGNGIAQLLLSGIFVGWIWSIWWGVILLKKGLEDK